MNQSRLPQREGNGRRSNGEIQKVLEAYRASGLSQREFAARHQVGISSLRYWLWRSRRQAPAQAQPHWVEVNVPTPAKPAKGGLVYQIALAGKILSVPTGFDSQELQRLLDILQGQSCSV